MPFFHSRDDLGNPYNAISEICHRCPEPVCITKNDNMELYRLLDDGLNSMEAGGLRTSEEVFSEIRQKLHR